MPDTEGTTVAFVLVTEDTFHAGLLIDRWLDAFGGDPRFRAVAVRAEPPPDDVLAARAAIRSNRADRRDLGPGAANGLTAAYPGATETDFALAALSGVPEQFAVDDPRIVHIGRNVNSETARTWLTEAARGPGPLSVFVFLDRLLASWWMETAGSRVFNAHSAVLPYARGMFAIEQVAASGDADLFRKAAGATVHRVEEGVDTGRIVRAERLADPFAAETIWGCKARSLLLAFRLLVDVAGEVRDGLPLSPVDDAAEHRLGPEFRRRDFTAEKREEAERGYRLMKRVSNAPTAR